MHSPGSTPTQKAIKIMSNISDDNSLIHGAIIAEQPISRARLGRLLRAFNAERLDQSLGRLVDADLVEKRIFKPHRGKRTTLYGVASR